jgi:hypothetical protein
MVLICLVAAAAGACARAMEIGSEPGPTYRIAVSNELSEAMIISSDHAGGDAILGSIPPGRSDTFVLARPVSTTIRLTARNSAGTRVLAPIPVHLRAGEAVPVRIR